MKKLIFTLTALALTTSGCATNSIPAFEENKNGEIVETQTKKSSNAGVWLGTLALVGVIILLSKDDGGKDSSPNCFIVLGIDGNSTRVCR